MNVRRLALEAISKIMDNKAFANKVVSNYLNKFEMSKEDKALFTNIVYGTIQYYLTLKFYIEPFLSKKKTKNWVQHLIYMSIYQLVYLDIPEYAAVNEAVEIANLRDRSIGKFVNAVLRNFLRNPKRDFENLDDILRLSIKYSHPSWLVAFFLKDYEYDVVTKILEENIRVKNDGYRVNTLLIKKEEILSLFNEEKIKYFESKLVENGISFKDPMINSKFFKKGYITVQDFSSQLVSEVLNPKPVSVVIDLCAAPGGKTAHMAALMNNEGIIHSCDISTKKSNIMNTNFKRLGVKIAKIQLIDARIISEYVKEESVDYILADVPCSGLGVLSHKVDLKYHINLKSISEIIKLQEEILESSSKLLKVGGYYLYSTCTLNKDENEKQINKFLLKNKNFSKEFEKTILPYEYNCDGFYICKLRRIN
jgi:16S rRNA (cytosine967-C5)-methyltransferase